MNKQKTIENYEQAKDKALRLLTFRAHSEYELRNKLKTAGAKDEDIERTLDFCRRYNFVNDFKIIRFSYFSIKGFTVYSLSF